jgi:hypothetical protein
VTLARTLPAAARDLAIGAIAVLFVASPALFTSRGFGSDFTNHLWLISQQSEAIAHLGHPTLFMHSEPGGIFQPFYGFYGGSLYAVVGGVSALLGQQPEIAYVGSIVLFAAMAYRGVWLLGSMAGLSRLLVHVPAYIFASSAYFLTDLYARGAWPELAALAALPFAIAYGVRLLRCEWTAGGVLGFAWGCVLLGGSHNITLLWSTVLIGLGGAAAWLVLGRDRPSLWQIGKVAGVAALAAGVNAWFLLLDLRHSSDTVVGTGTGFSWDFTKQFDTPQAIFTPLRTAPESGTFGLVVAVPVLALVVGLGLLVARHRAVLAQPRAVQRLSLVCAGLLVLVLGMMMMPESWWLKLGSPFTLIQFPYRLAGYAALVSSLLVLLCLRLAASGPPSRWITLVLVGLVAITTIQAGAQMWGASSDDHVPATKRDRSTALANGPTKPPATWYDTGSYRDSSRRVLDIAAARAVVLPIPSAGARSVTATVTLPAGDAPVFTNIVGGPYVVRISGVGVAGRGIDGRTAIVRLPGQPRRVTITATAAGGKPQTLAGTISILSILALLGLAAAVEVRRRRRPAEPQQPPATPQAGDGVERRAFSNAAAG